MEITVHVEEKDLDRWRGQDLFGIIDTVLAEHRTDQNSGRLHNGARWGAAPGVISVELSEITNTIEMDQDIAVGGLCFPGALVRIGHDALERARPEMIISLLRTAFQFRRENGGACEMRSGDLILSDRIYGLFIGTQDDFDEEQRVIANLGQAV